jgi:hypothetical protein
MVGSCTKSSVPRLRVSERLKLAQRFIAGLFSFTLKALANSSPGFALKPWGIGFTFISSQL